MNRMSYRLKYFAFALLLAVPLLGGVAVAHAQSFRTGTNVTVPAGQTLDSSLYASGSSLEIAGNVNGDVYCAGQSVSITGTVDGDVLCAGQTVDISGTVTGSVRLGGQTVTIDGKVGGSATIGAQSFTLQTRGSIGRDLTLGSTTAVLNGPVGRDVVAGNNTLNVNGQVGRNIQTRVDQLTLGSGANVGGRIIYTSANRLDRSPEAQVTGVIVQKIPPASNPVWAGSLVAVAWVFALYLFIAFLFSALVLVLLMPRVFHTSTTYAKAHLGKTFLVGLIASIVVPVVLLALAFTVIGLPLAILLGLVWLVVVLLSGVFAAYLLGRLLLRSSTNAIIIMLVGALVLMVVSIIPFVGAIVSIVAFWFGLGTVLLKLLGHFQKPQYDMGTEPEPVLVEEPPVPAKPRRVATTTGRK